MSGQNQALPLDDPIVIGRRGAARLRLSLPARLQTMTDTRRCILLDLSQTGAKIGLEEPLRGGASAILELHGIDQFGTIVRQSKGGNGGINGLEFEAPLTRSDVLAVRQFAETFEEREMQALRSEVRAWVMGAK